MFEKTRYNIAARFSGWSEQQVLIFGVALGGCLIGAVMAISFQLVLLERMSLEEFVAVTLFYWLMVLPYVRQLAKIGRLVRQIRGDQDDFEDVSNDRAQEGPPR